jgi:hypothetical protein
MDIRPGIFVTPQQIRRSRLWRHDTKGVEENA